MATDFYAVLGVSRDASAEDIKRAYRNLSKEWHPDKHKGDATAEQKFKEINAAYEVLGNADKRTKYDRFGSADGPGGFGGGAGGFDFSGFQNMGGMNDVEDLFSSFFGGGGGRRGGRRRGKERGEDMEIGVEVSLREAFSGAERTFTIRKPVACDTCKGAGAAEGGTIVTCETCSGTGQVERVTQSFFGMIRQSAVCDECGGAGKKPDKPCKTCRGQGRVDGRSEVAVRVPAGIATGQRLKVTGHGAAGPRGAEPGDLYVDITVLDDPEFQRDGDDVRSSVDVHVGDLLLGTEVVVDTLHGPSTVHVAEGTQPGQVLRIKGKGMPVISSSRTGDHYVEVRVVMPKKLSRAERKLLEEWRTLR